MKYFIQILVGSILASILILGFNAWSDHARNMEPSSSWFTINALFVEDHDMGSDPNIVMDRTIHKKFTARWIAEVHEKQPDLDGFSTVCWGNGLNDYSPGELLPNPLKLSWFMGAQCNLKVGTYRLCGTWTIQPINYPNKVVRYCSQPFSVRSK